MAGWKRAAMTLAVMTLVAFGGFALTACGPSNEEQVTKAIADELELVKIHDEATLDQLAGYEGADALIPYGIDAKSFISSFLEGFDYRIDEVTIDGESAQAIVTLTGKSFSAFTDTLAQSQANLAADESVANLSDEELNQRVGQALMEALGSVTASEKSPITLVFSKEDGLWKPTQDSKQTLANVLLSS